MSAPPIGMIERHAERERDERDQPEDAVALASARTATISTSSSTPSPMLMHVALRQQDRRARHAAVELQEGDDRAGESDRPDGGAERHFDQACAVDVAGHADAEGLRRVERAGGDQHRGEADQRVEECHKLRHLRSLRCARASTAPNAAADGHADDDENPGGSPTGGR